MCIRGSPAAGPAPEARAGGASAAARPAAASGAKPADEDSYTGRLLAAKRDTSVQKILAEMVRAELARRDHQGLGEQASLVQVFHQGGQGPVEVRGARSDFTAQAQAERRRSFEHDQRIHRASWTGAHRHGQRLHRVQPVRGRAADDARALREQLQKLAVLLRDQDIVSSAASRLKTVQFDG